MKLTALAAICAAVFVCGCGYDSDYAWHHHRRGRRHWRSEAPQEKADQTPQESKQEPSEPSGALDKADSAPLVKIEPAPKLEHPRPTVAAVPAIERPRIKLRDNSEITAERPYGTFTGICVWGDPAHCPPCNLENKEVNAHSKEFGLTVGWGPEFDIWLRMPPEEFKNDRKTPHPLSQLVVNGQVKADKWGYKSGDYTKVFRTHPKLSGKIDINLFPVKERKRFVPIDYSPGKDPGDYAPPAEDDAVQLAQSQTIEIPKRKKNFDDVGPSLPPEIPQPPSPRNENRPFADSYAAPNCASSYAAQNCSSSYAYSAPNCSSSYSYSAPIWPGSYSQPVYSTPMFSAPSCSGGGGGGYSYAGNPWQFSQPAYGGNGFGYGGGYGYGGGGHYCVNGICF